MNTGLFSGNDNIVAGYLSGMHRDMRMIKSIISTVSSSEFNTMALNSKLYKVSSYIQDDKAWDRIYIILKLSLPYLWVLHILDSNKAGMDKVFYYSILTKIPIIKSSSDIDNKELFPVSVSSSQKLWISSDSNNEED